MIIYKITRFSNISRWLQTQPFCIINCNVTCDLLQILLFLTTTNESRANVPFLYPLINGMSTTSKAKWLTFARTLSTAIFPASSQFQANLRFLCPVKTSENLWFSDVIKEYGNERLVWNGLLAGKIVVKSGFTNVSR